VQDEARDKRELPYCQLSSIALAVASINDPLVTKHVKYREKTIEKILCPHSAFLYNSVLYYAQEVLFLGMKRKIA
jgi:hypothetical protein